MHAAKSFIEFPNNSINSRQSVIKTTSEQPQAESGHIYVRDFVIGPSEVHALNGYWSALAQPQPKFNLGQAKEVIIIARFFFFSFLVLPLTKNLIKGGISGQIEQKL